MVRCNPAARDIIPHIPQDKSMQKNTKAYIDKQKCAVTADRNHIGNTSQLGCFAFAVKADVRRRIILPSRKTFLASMVEAHPFVAATVFAKHRNATSKPTWLIASLEMTVIVMSSLIDHLNRVLLAHHLWLSHHLRLS